MLRILSRYLLNDAYINIVSMLLKTFRKKKLVLNIKGKLCISNISFDLTHMYIINNYNKNIKINQLFI